MRFVKEREGIRVSGVFFTKVVQENSVPRFNRIYIVSNTLIISYVTAKSGKNKNWLFQERI